MSLLQLSKESYNNLINLSVSDYGSSSRLKNAMEKAQTGRVTIAFLGGSVTIGYTPSGFLEENYAAQFVRSFSERFCREGKCNCVNLGMAGENSLLGLALAEDRLRKEEPDIVFVEYAINSAMDQLHMAAFESLIVKLLNFESKPAVIPIIVCNADLYTCSSYMELVARHYDLPAVNIYNVLKAGLEAGLIEWENYSGDYGHPTENGHRLIADCIMTLMESVRERESNPCQLPVDACFSSKFSSFRFIDNTSLVPEESGSFETAVTKEAFPAGWSYRKNNQLSSFRFSVTCQSLFLLYETGNSMDYGQIELLKDDKVISRIDGYSIYAWGNPDIRLVFDEPESRLNRFEIRMRRGDEDKMFFLLGLGVVQG